MAAPPKYNSKYHDPWAFSLACSGATEEDIAEAMGIARMTVDRWKYVWEKRQIPVYDKEGNPVLDENGAQTYKPKWVPVTNDDGERILSSFGEELFKGKKIADAQIEQSLFKTATGFTVEEKEEIVEVGRDGRPKPLKIRKITRNVPPNVMAQMYWLNNRSRKNGKWSQKQEVTVSVGSFEALNEAFEAARDDLQ